MFWTKKIDNITPSCFSARLSRCWAAWTPGRRNACPPGCLSAQPGGCPVAGRLAGTVTPRLAARLSCVAVLHHLPRYPACWAMLLLEFPGCPHCWRGCSVGWLLAACVAWLSFAGLVLKNSFNHPKFPTLASDIPRKGPDGPRTKIVGPARRHAHLFFGLSLALGH